MPVVEKDIVYMYADEIPKLKALLIQSSEERQWVSTSIVDGRERWKFCRLSHDPSPRREPYYYTSPPEYPVGNPPKPGPKKKVPYTGDDTSGNRRAWHK